MKRSIGWAILALIAIAGWCRVPQEIRRGQIEHGSLAKIQIFAYRDWQSTGLRVHEQEIVDISAQGTWLYTPGEYHGPKGHQRYSSPSFYPLPGVPGGALIGRIGEEGEPFYVGEHMRRQVEHNGLLYLRIDDDILSDNEGFVQVEVQISPAKE